MTDTAVPAATSDNAGVRFPPPFLYVIVFGIALLLNWLVPLATLPLTFGRVAALALVLAGVLLMIWSNVLFRRAHTSLVPVKPSSALVTDGVYRLTRNPMYLGLLLVYLAAALWFSIIWALILAPLLVVAMQRMVIGKEERYLERRFGDEYRQYRAQVRRWI
ncbi:hypothetical protein SE17_30610 [Kouleothrix aurantiaca]|jgi:protein-S-isoprenylcysteine O-methyltransferase Ste14|uniref:Protein-S-isoprenylcysteine methyltransferase n=1 Tax=Kouleothrix aurantiaca TaxID=186479 RepID=A0A0P9D3E2_9CHLR|nr:hypothetical protein SE17_30610 [Kouleothrix aurantiaca]